VLTREQIACANASSGLNLVVLHYGLRDFDLSRQSVQDAFGASRDMAYLVHSGYRLNAYIAELYGPQFRAYCESSGFHVHTDYADYSEENHGQVPPSNRPYLMCAMRDTVAPGSTISHFFLFREPRLGLPPAEQDVLFRAVLNESDEEIAAALAISLDTVHKHWRAIYLRVWDAAPELLPGTQSPDGQSQRRGPEKRRHLLEYVRVHLEELRPYCHDRRRRSRRVSQPGVDGRHAL
jgi:DNA-binding CsgD family transcriptional regulator